MEEREALALVGDAVPAAGDDAAAVDGMVVTTDMLHERADFPPGTTRYTAGWRSVAASLSDIAATGAAPLAAVAAYGAPTFEEAELRDFLRGAGAVCETVDASYVGGDLDHHEEFTVATTAIGCSDKPIGRGGATPGDELVVTGPLGRSAAAVPLFETNPTRANELFRFTPRTAAGQTLAPHASAMTDSSDGLARSLHQMAERSNCGFAIESESVPIHDALLTRASDPLSKATTYGEDFELVAAVDSGAIDTLRAELAEMAVIGTVTESGVTMDGDPLPDEGYTHGS